MNHTQPSAPYIHTHPHSEDVIEKDQSETTI